MMSVGRPSRLTPDVHDRIVQLVRAGNYLKTAAGASGISEQVCQLWMARGRELAATRQAKAESLAAEQGLGPDDDMPEVSLELTENEIRYLNFYEEVTRARAEAQARHVAIIALAGEQDWRASAHYLERTDPSGWGRNDKVTTTLEGNPEKPLVSMNMNVNISKDELRSRIEAIRERRELSERLSEERRVEGGGAVDDDEIR
jgi:hypothetical protein